MDNRDVDFSKEATGLVPAPLSRAEFEALSTVYFIQGDKDFRQVASLLNSGRRAEAISRLQQLDLEMKFDGDMGLAPAFQ